MIYRARVKRSICLGMASGHVLQIEAQQDYYRHAVEIFRTLDDRKALASTLANLALCTLDPALAEEAIDIAHQIGWYSGEAYACMTAGYVHSFYGQVRREPVPLAAQSGTGPGHRPYAVAGRSTYI